MEYEHDWKLFKTGPPTKIPLPSNMTLLVPHLCLLLTDKERCPITDKTLRKAKRIAHYRYHPDRHPIVKKTDPLEFN